MSRSENYIFGVPNISMINSKGEEINIADPGVDMHEADMHFSNYKNDNMISLYFSLKDDHDKYYFIRKMYDLVETEIKIFLYDQYQIIQDSLGIDGLLSITDLSGGELSEVAT